MRKRISQSVLSAALLISLSSVGQAAGSGSVLIANSTQHFDAKGKPPSPFTAAFQEKMRQTLPFEDERDFEEAKRGFIVAPDYTQ
ncbi:MAG: MBL fold metallo-hydrolase, partial [Rhodobacteraceae bacterium]|nr:MBL fold metallo-hydrolase [Paracoccaceae bacterium]